MKLAIAGGGTGGHVYPGIAIAEEICRRGGEVFFIGTEAGMESTIVPKSGYRICTVAAAPIKRGKIVQNMEALFVTLRGFFDAVSILRREKPDVVFLDIMMPKLNGYEVCRQVNKDPAMVQSLNIVLLTAKGQEVDRRQGLELGAKLYMTKPFDPDEVLATARSLLGIQR